MASSRRLFAILTAPLLLPLVAVTAATATASAADGSLFQPMSGYRPSASANVSVRPTQFRAYRADLAGIRATLAGGPTTLTIPDPAGTPTEFTVAEDSVMAPSLQAAHPDIRTYAGSAANGTTIRLDVTPLGFHAMVRRPDGVSWYVEPATRTVGEDRVLSFAGAAAGDAPTLVEQEVRGAARQAGQGVDTSFASPGGLVTQRTYRLAFVTDPTYAAYVAPGATTHGASDPLVLSAKTTLINRVDEVYNDDVAYKFELIPGTDTKLNLLTAAELSGANGPCGANACYPGATGTGYSCDDVLDRNPWALGQLVGADSFDIGHIGLGVNGGGVAGLGVVGTADKAVGCTGIPTPVGDFYAIDYVAHEMGHQMGGNHTFNGTQTNCGPGNRNPATSVEPGSGSSIMAYAGICSSDNLQPHSDPYFSFRSIEEFEATTAAAPGQEQEEQVVNLDGFDGTDRFTLDCSGCSGATTIIRNDTNYNAGTLAAEITAITGHAATVTGYDSAPTPGAAGFTVHWAGLVDIPTLTVTPVFGAFTSFTGTIVNGGPDTNGGALVPSTDHAPVVTAPADKTIPTRTPFTLTGSATDQEGDPHIFQWEQTDSGVGPGTSLVSNTKVNGPLFRVFGTYADVDSNETLLYNSPSENLAGTDPSRTFPDLPQIVAGNTNAKTGTCPAPLAAGPLPVSDPALNCFSEFLPTSTWVGTGNRVMHFRLTTRDEFSPDPQADHVGGVAWDDVALTVDPTAGPFLVTSQATSAPQSGPTLVTWNVAGTDAASMAPNVRISLSTDGGQTFPTVLVASTPNDGQAPVLLPSNISTTTARIKVEAIGNYFFDLSDANFTIPLGGPNKAPVVDAGPDKAVQVGTAYTASGAFADENAGTAVASVDYGDGAGPQPLALTGSAFTLNHTYATSGAKTVTVRVTDSGSLVGTDTATVTVTKAGSTIKASSKPKKVTEDRAFKVKATVTSAIGAPTGKVKVYKGNKLIGKGTLHNGTVKIKIKQKKAEKLKVGKNKLTAKYLGSAAVDASQVDFKVTVVRKKR